MIIEYEVFWLTDISTGTGQCLDRSYLPITTPMAALDAQPGDAVRFDAEVRLNEGSFATGICADVMNARRSACRFRRPTRYRVVRRANTAFI